jgi:hypothetical protein
MSQLDSQPKPSLAPIWQYNMNRQEIAERGETDHLRDAFFTTWEMQHVAVGDGQCARIRGWWNSLIVQRIL